MSPEVAILRDTFYKEPPSPLDIDVEEIVKRHQKGEVPLGGKFDAVPTGRTGNHTYVLLGETDSNDEVFLDGEQGFAIRTRNANGELVVVCVVSCFSRPLKWINDIDDKDTRGFPRIVQMQGCTSPQKSQRRRGTVMQALSTFRLEDVCIDLVLQTNPDMEAVGILPASANPNRYRENFSMDRALVRYDGTAERRGFNRVPKGLYVKELG